MRLRPVRSDVSEDSEKGISNLGAVLGLVGLLAALLIVSIVVSLTLPSTPSTTTTTTSGGQGSLSSTTATTAAGGAGGAGARSAAAAACRSDVMDVQTALAAYQAATGSYPTPPQAWSATTYPANFAPLTSAPPPGPYLKMPPGDNEYVILWDSAGHVWVESPGAFTPTYDAVNDATDPSTCARVAR